MIDGLLDINGDDAVNGSDDGVAGGVLVIDGKLDTNFSGAIDGGDDDTFLGANVVDGGLDTNLFFDNVSDGNDDGKTQRVRAEDERQRKFHRPAAIE